MVYVFFADGFEEVEALMTVDILRRGGVNVKTVGVDAKEITGAHGVPVVCDLCSCEAGFTGLEMMVLPGGQPGTDNLTASKKVNECIDFCLESGVYIGAICAAPMVLGQRGLLAGRRAVCYPGCEGALTGAVLTDGAVVIDDTIITSRGPATAADFAFALLEKLQGAAAVKKIKEDMLF